VFVASNLKASTGVRRFHHRCEQVLDKQPDTPIYHYHHYERTHVRKLFDKYPDQPLSADELLERFIDLHKVLTESFVLPVEVTASSLCQSGWLPVSEHAVECGSEHAVVSCGWTWATAVSRRQHHLQRGRLSATKMIKEWLRRPTA